MQTNTKDLAQAHGSMAFFHFLQDRPAERFSRFEAYCYMLDKACANYRPKNIETKWIPAIGHGQFFITKTELAADWHWHRATVRWFLQKLSEFGHLSIEEHLKGILCTMHHLIIPVNTGVAIAYNFDSMAKYAMYSYARGTHNTEQTAIVCGQIERSASFMLDGNLLSPYTQKQLEEVQRTILHYAIEATLAHYPGKVSVDDEIHYSSMLVEKRLLELFRDYLGGNWSKILTLMSNQTELAFQSLVQSIHAGRTERARIWESLLQEAETLLAKAAVTAEHDEESPAGDSASSSTPHSSDSGTSPSGKDTQPDEYPSESDGEARVASTSATEGKIFSNKH